MSNELKAQCAHAPAFETPAADWRLQMQQQGFVIVRSLLSTAEVGQLQVALRAHFEHRWECEGLGKHQPNAAEEVKGIEFIFEQTGIRTVFEALFNGRAPVFTRNCDAHMNMLSWWHKDTSEGVGGCFPGDCFADEDLHVVRAGIYLQDQHEDGLTVKPGSHRWRELARGDGHSLRTAAGDVVFFDMRLTHAGQFCNPAQKLLIRIARRFGFDAQATALNTWCRRHWARRPDRLSVFFTFGTSSPATDAFMAFEQQNKARRRARLALRGHPDGRGQRRATGTPT